MSEQNEHIEPTPTKRIRRRGVARVLTPAFRRWAYGVTVAAVGVAVFAGSLPVEASPVVLPLLMAIFFVTDDGTPREKGEGQ